MRRNPDASSHWSRAAGSRGSVHEKAKTDRLTKNTICKNKNGYGPQAIRFIAYAVRLRANVPNFSVERLPYQARASVGFTEGAAQGLVQRLVKVGLPLPRPCMVSLPAKLEKSLVRNLCSLHYWNRQAD